MGTEEHLPVLIECHEMLSARIASKVRFGWETEWDERERKALAWAIEELAKEGKAKR